MMLHSRAQAAGRRGCRRKGPLKLTWKSALTKTFARPCSCACAHLPRQDGVKDEDQKYINLKVMSQV